MNKPVRAAILGTPVSSGNRGVLALGSSLVNLCAVSADPCEAILLLGHDNNRPVQFQVAGQLRRVPVVHCRLSPYSPPRDHLAWIVFAALLYRLLPFAALRRAISGSTPWIKALETADIVGDIRGGDSFSDIYGMKRFLNGFLMAWTVLLVKGRMVQFPQTFGPYHRSVARWLARFLMRRSSIVIARDEKSRQIAQNLIGSGRTVWLSPDVAFSLEAILPRRIDLDPPLDDRVPSRVIGLNVNGLMANGGYTRKNMFNLKLDYRSLLPELVKALLAVDDSEIWLVPHTYGPAKSVESDPEASRQLRQALPESLKRRVRIVAGEYDQYEIKGIIGQCNFFIGSRMHACIAALSQGVPCVGVAYSMKFEGVFDSVGMHGWVVDGRTETNEEAIARILELYRKRDSVREDLAKNADRAKTCLRSIFKQLIANSINPVHPTSFANIAG